MRVLFYLPVITEWWFDNVMVNLIRAAAKEAEVHVAVTPMWRLTGIREKQLESCVDLPEIRWHVLGGDGHRSLRTRPLDREALLEFVRGIDPDYTFCRSADIETPSEFPGKVAFVMEGGIPPFEVPRRATLTSARLFDHGMLPPLDAGQRAYLDGRIAPGWDLLRAENRPDPAVREDFLAAAGLSLGRKVIAFPLDYEGPDNFFLDVLSAAPQTAELVERLAARMGDDFVLAITKHPIERNRSFDALEDIAADQPERVRIVEKLGTSGNPTLALMRHCDGMIARDSKTFANCAFLGKPMLRLSNFASGEWMNVYADVDTFMEALRAGRPRAADLTQAKTWFAFHYANNAFRYNDPNLSLAALIDHIDRPFNQARWEANLDSCREFLPSHFV